MRPSAATRLAALLVMAVAASSCSHETSGRAQAVRERLGCGQSAAPLVTLARRSPYEPQVAIPQPHGWVQRQPALGADLVRLMMGNPSLKSDGQVPNMIAIVDSFSPTADHSAPGQRAMADELDDIARTDTAKIVEQTPGTVCGYPSLTVTYTIQGLESMALIVTSRADGGQAWRVRLNFLSHDAHNPRWIADTRAIADGLAIKAQGS